MWQLVQSKKLFTNLKKEIKFTNTKEFCILKITEKEPLINFSKY